MKKVIEFLKNRIVISIIGLLALSILIWFFGPMIKFGEGNTALLGSSVARLIAIILILLLWGLNNLRIQLLDKKHNNELVEDLEENQEEISSDLTSEQSAEEIHQINKRFSEALDTLKRLKFSGRGKAQALYELPWYIIIGPPGSGKTTALVNSSLEFPLAEQFGKGAVQGIGGTRNCDWWFTNDAVLIDTAGRYTTQDSHRVVDSKAWEGFLKLLKRNRRRRPINGAIVAISIHDLLLQTEEERMQHAKIIRMRIDELMEKLEIRFPIYLMFTKVDLVSGFMEFFEDLSKDEREQVWGISLPNAPGPSQTPDYDYLENEFQNLLERLYSRQLSRIHFERDTKRRAAIQGFPQQVENLKSIVTEFINQAFINNRYHYQPYLRGIYFTSGTQDGTPIDRLMTSVSSNFGFARENVQLQHSQGKSFFLGSLFKQVMFPESELVGSNRKYEILIKWAQRGAYAGIALFSVVILSVWAGSVTRHNSYMSEVEGFIAEFHAEKKHYTPWNKDLRVVLPTLNALAKASVVYDQNAHPWLSGMGLYDGDVDSSADDAYKAQLNELFLPRIIDYLEKQIRKGHSGGDLYEAFRVYLMFNKIEYMDKEMVLSWFVRDWNEYMQGEATRRKELEAHLVALLDIELQPYALDTRLVKSARELLLRVPVQQRIYSRVRNNPEYAHEVDMLNQFGEAVRDVFEITQENAADFQMPYMFTKAGYEKLDLSTESPVIEDIINERWVLSDSEDSRVDFVKDDLDEISQKVKELYFADYVAHWDSLFKALSIKKFSSIREARDVLAKLTDPVYSPLLSILQVTAENTTLSNQLMQNINDDYGEGRAGTVTNVLSDKFDGNRVDRAYREMNMLLRESGKKPAPVTSLVNKIQEIQAFMGEVAVSPDPSKKAFEVAKARYMSGAGNAITSLRAHSNIAPQPVQRWFIELSNESWKVILSSAKGHVNSEWRARVHDTYSRALSGRYPLTRSSKDELALFDFSEFFKPKGTMDSFYAEFIKPFINTRGGWGNRLVDGYSLGYSRSALDQIQRSQMIMRIFFRDNQEVPGVSFQLKPFKMEKYDARFQLEVGEQRISYNHGPKFWKSLNWSGGDESRRVRIVFEDLAEFRHEKTYEGPWAWFRLQDHSRLTKTSQSNVYMVTYGIEGNSRSGSSSNNDYHHIQYLIKAKSVDNPFNENLLGTFRCPENI